MAVGARRGAVEEVAHEAKTLRTALEQQMLELGRAAGAGAGVQAHALWLGQGECEAVATALGPKYDQGRRALEGLLYEVVALEVRQRCQRHHNVL